MSEREVIGEAECVDCGAPVELRVDRGGRVYGVCDGRAAKRLCGASFKLSMPTSRRMVEEAKNAKSQSESAEGDAEK